MKIKRIFQNLALLALSVFIAMAFLEIVLRLVPDNKNARMMRGQDRLRRDNEFAFYEYDKFLGWKNKSLAEGPFVMPSSKTHVKINSKGLRDSEYAYEKEAGLTRILILGDSFTWGYGVEKKEIFTEKLEKMLGANFEVINAGVTGYGTDQELIFLEREGLKYHPDIVILAFASNDFMQDNVSDFLGYYPKPYFILSDGGLRTANFPLPEIDGNSWNKLYNLRKETMKKEFIEAPKRKIGKLKSLSFLADRLKKLLYTLLRKAEFLSPLRALGENEGRKGVTLTKALISRMNEDCKSADARLIVFIIPYKCALEKLPDPYMREFKEFFASNGIPYIDPYDDFLKKFGSGESFFLEYDDHWNASGHALAAETIYEFLKKR